MYQASYDTNGKVIGVLRLADKAFISKSVNNPDWRAFLSWDSAQPSPLNLTDIVIPPDDPLNMIGLPARVLAALTLRFSASWTDTTTSERQKIMDLIDQAGVKILGKIRE